MIPSCREKWDYVQRIAKQSQNNDFRDWSGQSNQNFGMLHCTLEVCALNLIQSGYFGDSYLKGAGAPNAARHCL